MNLNSNVQQSVIPPHRKHVYIGAYVFALALLALGLFGGVKTTSAQGASGFGGTILYTQECLCSGGYMITVGPPTPGLYVFQFGVSQLFPYGQIFKQGAQVLGTALQSGTCIPLETECLAAITAQTIVSVGTSL